MRINGPREVRDSYQLVWVCVAHAGVRDGPGFSACPRVQLDYILDAAGVVMYSSCW